LAQVTAVVRIDGQPLSNVLVTFVPLNTDDAASRRSMGVSDDKGRVKLVAESREPGAVVGKHRVIVEDLEILNAPRSDDGTVIERPASRFPTHYGDLARSPLVVEVEPGSQDVELALKSQ
jgi:hypothetical protein